ncbi:MAG: MFS transporter [Ktedonobacterales bacterium]|nr:MFS transporter [Ktedonobacterales bacterium]
MSEAPLPRTSPIVAPDVLKRSARYAGYIFWLMFFINFINYVDRWVFSALAAVIKTDLSLSLFQIGLLGSAFLLVYTLVAYPLGLVADRVSRKKIVAGGVALWSIATALTAFAGNFASMVAVRALVGVGEGSYYPAGTPMLVAWYPPKRRADILARWGVGSLIGIGVGFLIGSVLAGPSWRLAFIITGAPGLLLALLIAHARERARSEDDPDIVSNTTRASFMGKAREVLGIPTLRVILAIHALGFFALASLATYLVIYLDATYGPSSSYGNAGLGAKTVALVPGVILIIGGIAGNLIGSAWSNRLSRRDAGARVKVGGYGFLLAMPFVVLTLSMPYVLRALPSYQEASAGTQVTIGVAAFAFLGTFATLFLNIYNGPTSAALQDVLRPADRGAGGGLELTLAHLLGDSCVPAFVGALAAVFGNQIGLSLLATCPLVLTAAGIVGIWGSRFYAKDVAALGSSAETMLGVPPSPAA